MPDQDNVTVNLTINGVPAGDPTAGGQLPPPFIAMESRIMTKLDDLNSKVTDLETEVGASNDRLDAVTTAIAAEREVLNTQLNQLKSMANDNPAFAIISDRIAKSIDRIHAAGATATADAAKVGQLGDGTPAAANLTLSPASVTVAVGGTTSLSAAMKDQDGADFTGGTTGYVSSDTSVATVDNTGTVTGVASGSATITATNGTATGTASVSVS